MKTILKPNLKITVVLLSLIAAACGGVGASAPAVPASGAVTDAVVAPVAAAVEADLEKPGAAVTPTSTGTPAQATSELEATLVDLYSEANPSVVFILVSAGNQAAPSSNAESSGSGFVFDDAGHLVTNNHVVEGAQSIEVVFASGERVAAEVVGSDEASDLAVLKVDEVPAGVEPLPLASESVRVGQFVVAIGNPFGEQGSMSFGIVSGLGRSLAAGSAASSTGRYSLPDVVQTDAPINPGNSGGPLLNLDGEVVGITAAIATTSGTGSGVGFAIPARIVARVVPSLVTTGSYEYAYIGASFDGEVTLAEVDTYGLEQTDGAYVVAVTAGSPADEAGLTAADANTGQGGDLVVAIDGHAISSFADLNSYLVANASPGQTIELTIWRAGAERQLALTLGTRP